jgi:hypothetical protein
VVGEPRVWVDQVQLVVSGFGSEVEDRVLVLPGEVERQVGQGLRVVAEGGASGVAGLVLTDRGRVADKYDLGVGCLCLISLRVSRMLTSASSMSPSYFAVKSSPPQLSGLPAQSAIASLKALWSLPPMVSVTSVVSSSSTPESSRSAARALAIRGPCGLACSSSAA